MRRLATLGLILLLAASARADEPIGEVYTTRLYDEDHNPKVGEEAALGGYAYDGRHMGTFCYRDQAAIMERIGPLQAGRLDPRPWDYRRALAEGIVTIIPYGTPVTVVRRVDLRSDDGKTPIVLIVVRFEGGPSRGREGVVTPHEVLRRRTKEELAVEGNVMRLPGYFASASYQPKAGDEAAIGYIDDKPGANRAISGRAKTHPPILRQDVPAFSTPGAFRDYFAPPEDPAPDRKPPRSPQSALPPATWVKILRVIPAEGETPASAEVRVTRGPLEGQSFIVPARGLVKIIHMPAKVLDDNPLFVPDYSPASDHRPTKGPRRAAGAAPKAEPHTPPSPAARAASLLGMARGSEKAGHAAAALKYYKELVETFPDAPEASDARRRILELEPR